MTVLRTEEWLVRPGRVPDFLALMAETEPLSTAFGGREHQVLRLGVAGPDIGRYMTTADFDDIEAYAAYVTRWRHAHQDPARQELIGRMRGPESPMSVRCRSLLTALATFGRWPGAGGVLLIWRWQVAPEAVDAFLMLGQNASVGLEAAGSSLRIYQTFIGGPHTGDMCTVAGFPDRTASGAIDRIARAPALETLLSQASGARGGATVGTLLESRLAHVVQ